MAIKVYIAGPYSSDPEQGTSDAIAAWDHLYSQGYCPFCPHLTHYIDKVYPRHYEDWMRYDREWVQLCDVLLRLPGASDGADREVALAESLGIPVFYKINDLVSSNVGQREPAPDQSGELRVFEGGAKRSKDADEFRFDLISPIALREIARTCAEGAAKYGDFNWERGMPVHDLINHAENHINDFLGGKQDVIELAHAAWNLMSAIHSLLLWPHLNQGHLRGPGCTPPTAA